MPGRERRALPAVVVTVGTEPRRPLHVVWFIGLSAAIYALDLAAVAAMQAGTDAGVAAQQAPAQAAVEALRAQDASVAQDIQRASTSLQAGAAAYALAGKNLASLEQRLAGLGRSAASLQALPAVPTVRSVAAAPVVHATSGASGAKP